MREPRAKLTLAALGGTVALALGGCGGIIDEKAEEKLRQEIGNTSMTVFPVFVRDGDQKRYDQEAAKTIGDFLTEEELATVTVAEAEVPITSEWGSNQAQMLRDSAADFTAYVQGNQIETAYAMLPEYLIGGKGVPVGVHLYLLDAEGTVAYALLFNSHHKEFNDVDPKTVDDCTTIVINKLRDDFVGR